MTSTAATVESMFAGLSAERKRVAGRFRWAAERLNCGAVPEQSLTRVYSALSACCVRFEAASLCDSNPKDDSLLRGRCRNRHCPYCHALDGSRVADVLAAIFTDELAKGSQLAMLTLTVRHDRAEHLRAVRKQLDKAFARFQKRQLFKAVVADYHRVAEAERSVKGGPHPHFHLALKLRADVHKRELQKLWRAGELSKSPLWRWYKRRERLKAIAACKRGGKSFGKKARAEFNAWLRGQEAAFVTMTPKLLEGFLRDEWLNVTFKLNRPSYCVRLTMIRPGKKPGTALKRWRDRFGTSHRVEIPVEKLVKEFTKYVTKKQATGKKAGQLGFHDYTPWQVYEHWRGLRNWHMHQSSRGWAAAADAHAQDELLQLEAEDAANGRRTVNYVDLALAGTKANFGSLSEDGVVEFERDALRVLRLLDRDRELDGQQALALRNCLGRLFGDDTAAPIDFPLTHAQTARLVRIAKDKDAARYFRAQLELHRERAVDDAAFKRQAEALADESAEREAVNAIERDRDKQQSLDWSSEVNAAYAAMGVASG